LWAT